MKKIIAIIYTLIATATMAADVSVQQKITVFNAENKQEQFQVKWSIADGNCRLEMLYTAQGSATTTVFLPKPAEQKMQMYVVGGENYFDVNSSAISANQKTISNVSFTNETKKIGEYTCNKVLVSLSDGGEVEFWYTDKINFDANKYTSLLKSNISLAALARENKIGFPLEMIERDQRGIVNQRITFESSNTNKIESTAFQVPANYKLYTSPNNK